MRPDCLPVCATIPTCILHPSPRDSVCHAPSVPFLPSGHRLELRACTIISHFQTDPVDVKRQNQGIPHMIILLGEKEMERENEK